jgi:hypothetical protein
MTDENKIEDQEVDLHDDDNDVVEEAHDPKNAEAQSIASVDKAENAGKTATKRKGDQTKQDPMPKMPGTKAGMINAMYMKASKMKKEDLAGMYSKMMAEDADLSDESITEVPEIDYNADFKDDLNALVNEEATLSEEFKEKAEIIFEAAIKSKLAEEIDRLEEKYNEELAEEVTTTKAELVEKVDSYLNYVVENWMDENKVAIQNGLRTEIAEKFMNSLKDLFTESYIEVPESKVDIVDELAETVDELEGQLNASIASGIEMQEKLEVLQRDAIIREHSTDLAETQIEKLKSLVEDVDFDDWDSFSTKVLTVKESYFTKKVSESADIVEEDDDGTTPIHTSPAMEQYLSAIKKTQK